MLKKIAMQELRLGMFLQSVEGSWLSHPFWKARFLLTDPEDLRKLQSCGATACWIDSARGADVGGDAAPATAAAAPAAAPEPASATSLPAEPAAPQATEPAAAAPARVEMASELERAAQVMNRARTVVTSLFGEARLGRAVQTEQCIPLVEEIADSVTRNPSALISLARLKTKDDYTYMHSVAVCALMVSLGRQMGFSDAQSREAGLAGLLHDVGKMAMPLEVLNKPGALTDDEYMVMKSHPVRGFELLREGGAVPHAALDVCLHHHEKMDGTGYPRRLSGTQISLLARMGAVCDVYDAITSNRPYKTAWDPAGSLARMAQWKGHFDPEVFQAFIRCVGIYPVGTLVRLQSGRLGVVVEQNATALTAPIVRVFFSTKSQLPIPTEVLDLAAADAHDRITGREDPAEWGFSRLEELWTQPAG